jgi:hypothetical protein
MLPEMCSSSRRNAIYEFMSHCTTTLPVIFGWIVQ